MDGGALITERDVNWSEIDVSAVRRLALCFDGRVYALPEGPRRYVQGKTASVPMEGGDITIESRYIGFRHGNHEYCLRVDEYTNDVSVEIKEVIQ